MLNSNTTLTSVILSFFLMSSVIADESSSLDAFLDSDLDGIQDSEDAYPHNKDLSQAKVHDDCSVQNLICSIYKETFNSVELTIYNNSSSVVTMDLEYESTNIRSTKEIVGTFTIQPKKSMIALQVSAINEDDYWELNWTYWYQQGDYTASHMDDFIYMLPYLNGESYLVSQSYHGDFSHKTGANQYAIDFAMNEGTPILAARGGKVVKVVEKFIRSGTNSYFLDKANIVIIEQEDGTHAEYAHIQRNGAYVEEGDHVEAGQKIALSGNTGFSTGPHLHFAITSPLDGKSKTSYPIIVQSNGTLITEPIKGSFYTSENELYIKPTIENNDNVTTPSLSSGTSSGSSSGGGVIYWPYLFALLLIVHRKRPLNNQLKLNSMFKIIPLNN